MICLTFDSCDSHVTCTERLSRLQTISLNPFPLLYRSVHMLVAFTLAFTLAQLLCLIHVFVLSYLLTLCSAPLNFGLCLYLILYHYRPLKLI